MATGPDALGTLRHGRTVVIANSQEIHTAAFIQDPKTVPDSAFLTKLLQDTAGTDRVRALNATKAARALMGDSIGSNILMLGYAWQQGRVPVGRDAMMRAIELNGVAVDANKRLFNWGCLLAADPDYVASAGATDGPVRKAENLETLIARRAGFLTDYQDAAYARRYTETVQTLRRAEAAAGLPGDSLTRAAAKGLFKLMAYKDEYEVARLFTDGAFQARLKQTFDGDFRVTYHMAPPFLSRPRPGKSEPEKRAFGPWMATALKGVARFKSLRGTRFDPFGWTQERRTERALIRRYEDLIAEIAETVTPASADRALAVLDVAEDIKGFGPVKERALETGSCRDGTP